MSKLDARLKAVEDDADKSRAAADKLSGRVDALETQVDDLETRVDELEQSERHRNHPLAPNDFRVCFNSRTRERRWSELD